MIYLLSTIILTSGLFLIFKLFDLKNVSTFHAIVINYITCAIIGTLLNYQHPVFQNLSWNLVWVRYTALLGVFFILTFYLMAFTAQKVSVSVSTIANKMAMVVPVFMSLFVFEIQRDSFTIFNLSGIILAFPAIILSSVRRENSYFSGNRHILNFLLPLAVFLLGGAIDTTINYLNHKHLSVETEKVFPFMLFLAAGLTGTLILIYRWIILKEKLKLKTVGWGIFLGIPNYFSIYFLIKTLSAFNNNGAVVFPMLNIGIILCSSFLAVLIFKEKLIPANKVGVIIAIIALILVGHQPLYAFLNRIF